MQSNSPLSERIADFPRTADLRVYHLGLRAGEVANRIVRHRTTFSEAMFLIVAF